MNKKTYHLERLEIDKKYIVTKNKLHEKYASENNPYKLGDILTGSGGIIIIYQTGHIFIQSDGYASIAYSGITLKKNLEPRKDGKVKTIYWGIEKLK